MTFPPTRTSLGQQLAAVAGGCLTPWPAGGSAGNGVIPKRETDGAALRSLHPPVKDARVQRLEAVLFLTREPLNSRKLAQFANLADGTEARTLIRLLNRLYDAQGRAFRVEEVAGGFQLLTRRKFAAWLRRLGHVPPEIRLSAPALETLAVIAYRQPVLRADIEAVRGVNCGEILRLLMERDLVRIGGRSEELGRPYLYTTTKRFLQLFGLTAVEDLPTVETFPAFAPGPAATSVQVTTTDYKSDIQAGFQDKESDVSVTTLTDWQIDEEESARRRAQQTAIAPRLEEDEDEFEDEELDDEDDEEDDLDDEEDDEEEDDEDLDEDFDDEWEEVEDEDDEDEDEEDDEDDWDDEDDDLDEEEEEDDEV